VVHRMTLLFDVSHCLVQEMPLNVGVYGKVNRNQN
jgi:hypothetical protein